MIDLKDGMSIARDTAVTLAAISGGIVAWLGLQTWRRQLKGQTEYALAKRMLVSAYKIRGQVRDVRNASIDLGEMTHAMKEAGIAHEGLTMDDFTSKGTDAAYRARMRSLVGSWQELSADLLEGSAIWEDSPKAHFAALEQCLRTLNVNMILFLRRRPDNLPTPRVLKLEEVIYDQGTEDAPDEFGSKLNEAVRTIEVYLKPHLRR